MADHTARMDARLFATSAGSREATDPARAKERALLLRERGRVGEIGSREVTCTDHTCRARVWKDDGGALFSRLQVWLPWNTPA